MKWLMSFLLQFLPLVVSFPSLLFLFSTGVEDPPHTKKNRPILRNGRLCQTDHTERGYRSLLQGLCTQHAEYCSLRWHWPGCLRGQRDMKALSIHSASLLCLPSSHSLCSTDSEVCLAEQEQRFSWPRGHGAGRLRCRFKHLWAAGKLPTGTDPHPDAGTRSG